MFDALDEAFGALIKGFELKNVEEVSDEDLYNTIESELPKWDDSIQRRTDEWSRYIDLSRNIYNRIEGSINQDDIESKKRSFDELEPLRRWIFNGDHPYSFVWVLYHSQRMTQLRRMAELYGKGAKGEVITWRHLFEEGLKKERVSPERYLNLVYSIQDSYSYQRQGLAYMLLRHVMDSGEILCESPIQWEKDKLKAKRIDHQLAVHLKYAELAYRGVPAKGLVKDVLDPYVINYGKYKGTNVNGFFRLQGDLNGFVGSRRNTAKTIVIGFSGTDSLANCWTDIRQYFGYLDPAYVEALALLKSVWIGRTHKKGFENSKIVVCGHSLGGGVMQYAVASMMKTDEITGYGYNSAGLSWKNIRRLPPMKHQNIFHLYLPKDVVFKLPPTYQLGKAVALEDIEKNRWKAHKIKVMRAHLKECRHDLARMEE